ncbi:hypothetical protein Pint_12899 [Pistacia integerrima]|uniref:Uncharacterized protein n=1 Tax=Pistacia integerrima TaxID=434235 RepID=A0ACC0Y8P9_9ROSI|nr:hypothetical protein Pint_12899 [Pistacia integerrima]
MLETSYLLFLDYLWIITIFYDLKLLRLENVLSHIRWVVLVDMTVVMEKMEPPLGKLAQKGLYGIFCEECPVGTYKNVTGSDKSLCHHCPAHELPHRAVYISVRGGIAETPCPYECISDRYHMPHCYTALEELIYTFGGPWLFCLLLIGLLILLALVLSVARMKFVGVDELPGPAPTQQGSQIDHSFPFLESLNEVSSNFFWLMDDFVWVEI